MSTPLLHVELAGNRADKQRAFDAARGLFRADMERLGANLLDGTINAATFETGARQAIKDLHVMALVAGRNGDWGAVTKAEWGRVGNVLRNQYAHLSKWMRELQDLSATSLAKLLQRGGYYADAAKRSFAAGVAADAGIDPAILPAWPGDATTSCRTGCKCRWVIRVISKARHDFNVSWRLGTAEHCVECRARSRSWLRLRIRGGRFIDPVEMIFR